MNSRLKNALVEVTELPSKFMPYPSNTKIFYRPYTYGEADSFSDSKVSNSKALEFVLDGVNTDGIDKYNLTLGDFLYIALLRKISSFGTLEFQVAVTYKRELFKKVVTHEDIVFDDIKAEKLPVVFTMGGRDLHFYPLTIKQYIELLDKDLDNERAIIAMQCDNLPFDDAYNIINDAIGRDITYLKEVDGLLSHSVAPLDVVFNIEDKEVHKSVAIDDPNTLVLPFLGHEESSRSPIRFGV